MLSQIYYLLDAAVDEKKQEKKKKKKGEDKQKPSVKSSNRQSSSPQVSSSRGASVSHLRRLQSKATDLAHSYVFKLEGMLGMPPHLSSTCSNRTISRAFIRDWVERLASLPIEGSQGGRHQILPAFRELALNGWGKLIDGTEQVLTDHYATPEEQSRMDGALETFKAKLSEWAEQQVRDGVEAYLDSLRPGKRPESTHKKE